VGEFTITCSFRNVVDNFIWVLMGVYGHNVSVDRRLLWDELAGLLSWWNLLG
jgi:hypothetical protein